MLDTGLTLAQDTLATAPNGLRLSNQALNIDIAIEDRQQAMLADF